MYCIRGATTIENDNKEDVLSCTEDLLKKIIDANDIKIENIISIIFSCTRDITSAYPAEAARNMGIVRAGLMCLQEMYVEKSLEKCIRVLMFVDKDIKQEEAKHIYINGAKDLRKDL
ncbi:chorismate mutase [Caloramator quimbayensis]|uniref:chorismate mutase n=1 Tax=Caloramator quimbayensis TaxID=1147123 RepID=A0A1T4X211_9CLOT|nr:chorismate mutase [Caloramator quimbayensis]SKA83178.1 chorismate mutase [Caloramator quimbayensis]